MKKLIALTLVIITLFSLVSCNKPGNTNENTDGSEIAVPSSGTSEEPSGTPSSDVTDPSSSSVSSSQNQSSNQNPSSSVPASSQANTTDSSSDNTPQYIPGKEMEICKDAETDYVIVYSSSASEDIASIARTLKTAFRSKQNVSIPLVPDAKEEPVAHEIILGETNRCEGLAAKNKLGKDDYKIYFENGKIYIIGGSEKATKNAATYFAKNVLTSGSSYMINENFVYTYKHTYPITSTKIANYDMSSFKIVTASEDRHSKAAADYLNAYLSENCGFSLAITEDTSAKSDFEIRIGKTTRTGAIADAEINVNVENNGKALNIISGKTETALSAVKFFINKYLTTTGTVTLSTSLNTKATSVFLTKTGDVRITCAGDSLTAGAQSSNVAKLAYPPVLDSMLPQNFECKNFGVGGTTMTIDVLETANGATFMSYYATAQYKAGKQFNPTIVLLMLGCNDSVPLVNNAIGDADRTSRFITSGKTMINEYKAVSSNPTVFLMTPVQVSHAQAQASRKNNLDNNYLPLVKQLASECNVPLLDIYQRTADLDELYADGLHFNDDGYRYLAGIVLDELVSYYGFN
ncbi:MAG: hypothetical protein J5922_05335 [Clostridia bacterium]|nr:hypothetical protein [Clostridia bacterium]